MTTNDFDEELDTSEIELPFQEEYDDFVKRLSYILNDSARDIDEDIEQLLRKSLDIFEKYRKGLQDLEYYKMKFNPVRPKDMVKSQIKKCKIGHCQCGELLIESRGICCRKCRQFIDWSGNCEEA